ncbi:hypothetical protein PR202_gb12941 [Eleusine coracana subsp. coracana]|uniref:Uncharacterized protein n=1 Tax=Eleusine coracana subsp. coracana TaxID=191504 RepID=A0AAV5ESC4_ELECO|nr:hypothetical protein PR202_gb12941 [Eleusine coracana subsp. coracana]
MAAASVRAKLLVLFLIVSLGVVSLLRHPATALPPQAPEGGVKLRVDDEGHQVIVDNGLVRVALSTPRGQITAVSYGDKPNLLQYSGKRGSSGGYWDMVWNYPGSGHPQGLYDTLVMLRGSSGFYSYAIFEHAENYPALNITEARLVFKLNRSKFDYMAVTDDIQRHMPRAIDRLAPRGVELSYKEAVLLVDPNDPQFQGEMFLGTHYVGKYIVLNIEDSEHWKKVLGPVFIYINSIPKSDNLRALWEDAKAQAQAQVTKWPYDFLASPDFAKPHKRGSITGRLFVRDYFMSNEDIPARMGYVGLASPGQPGSWATERFLGDYMSSSSVTIAPAARYRQYGLWERYAASYPKDDLVFIVGKSNSSKDWFYAQVTR